MLRKHASMCSSSKYPQRFRHFISGRLPSLWHRGDELFIESAHSNPVRGFPVRSSTTLL